MEDDLSLGRTVVLGSQISTATLKLTVGRLYAYNGPAMGQLWAIYGPSYRPVIGLLLARYRLAIGRVYALY